MGIFCQVHPNQRFRHCNKHAKCKGKHAQYDHPLDSEAMSDSFVISRSGKLCRKNTSSRESAKDTDIKNEQQLVDNCYRGHFKRTHATNPHIVQQADNVGYRILYNDRHNNGDHFRVKGAVTYKLASQSSKPALFHHLFPPRTAARIQRIINRICGLLYHNPLLL